MFMLTPYVQEVTGKLRFGFPRIISTIYKYSAFVISGGKTGKIVGKIHHYFWQNKTITQLNGSIYYTSFSLSGVHLHRVELNETYGEVSDKICLTLLLFKVVRRIVSLPPLFSTVLQDFALTLRRLMSYIYMEHPFLMFLDHTQRRSTVGRTPLDE